MQQNGTNDDERLKEDASKALKNLCEKTLLNVLLPMFGLSYFCKGHMATIEHVLNFQNTMFSLPTRVGKSLCYQGINMLK
jgi:superfamily II DNA helicase RecQ